MPQTMHPNPGKPRRGGQVTDSTTLLSNKFQLVYAAVVLALIQPKPTGPGLGDWSSAKAFLKKHANDACALLYKNKWSPKCVSIEFFHVFTWARIFQIGRKHRDAPELPPALTGLEDLTKHLFEKTLADDSCLEIAPEYEHFFRQKEKEKGGNSRTVNIGLLPFLQKYFGVHHSLRRYLLATEAKSLWDTKHIQEWVNSTKSNDD